MVTVNAVSAEAESHDIKVATDFWPPFRIDSGNGRISGIDRDVLNEIASRLHIHFHYDRLPWSRCLLYLKKGVEDIMPGVARTPERSEYILFSETPYYSCSPAFYARKGHSRVVRSYKDLKGQTIGYTRSSAYFPKFDHDESLKKFDEDKEGQLLKMLLAGRIDLIIGTDCQVDYDIAHSGYDGKIIKMPYKPEDKIDLYMGVSRRSEFVSQMKELNKALKEIVNDGTVQHIAHKYFKH